MHCLRNPGRLCSLAFYKSGTLLNKGLGVLATNSSRILIIDPRHKPRTSFARVTRALGLRTDLANTKTEATYYAGKHEYDIIAAHQSLRQESCGEFIDLLRSMQPTSSYILVTDAPCSITDKETAEYTRVLSKPGDRSAVSQIVRWALDRRKTTLPTVKTNGDNLVLVVGDATDQQTIDSALECDPMNQYTVVCVPRLSLGQWLVDDTRFRVIVCNLNLPDAKGLDIVDRLLTIAPQIPLIVLGAKDDQPLALQALQHGAEDYILQSESSPHDVYRAIRYAIERKQSQIELAFYAHRDPLTKLLNRTTFEKRVSAIFEDLRNNGRTAALYTLCVDRFKGINHMFGEDTGDAVLQAVAERIQSCVRDTDLVARLDGNEFAVLIDGLSTVEEANEFTQRLASCVEHKFTTHGIQTPIHCRIGVSLFPRHGNNFTDIWRSASAALADTKLRPSHPIRVFDKELSDKLDRRHQIATELQTDLQSDVRTNLSDKLHILYQPLVSLQTNAVVGVEALLRWNRKSGPTIGPEHFIPILEDLGLMVPVGKHVLEQACAQLSRWQTQGHRLRMCVNVSPIQFENPAFVATVQQCLTKYNISPDRLELEVTESLLFLDIDSAVTRLHALRDLGVRVALDDFGTGHSSLARLASLPINTLKIDRSFVRNIGVANDSAIAKAIIDLGHTVDKKIVAEGVETVDQANFLRNHHCDYFQGYFLSKPVPANVLQDWLLQRPPVS